MSGLRRDIDGTTTGTKGWDKWKGLDGLTTLILIVAIVAAAAGAFTGAYFAVCLAIHREDRRKWSLRSDARSSSAQQARDFVGISGASWK
jgi:hypothetical protein